MRIKIGITIAFFFIIGLIISIVTGEYFYYIPSSIVVGVIFSMTIIKNLEK